MKSRLSGFEKGNEVEECQPKKTANLPVAGNLGRL